MLWHTIILLALLNAITAMILPPSSFETLEKRLAVNCTDIKKAPFTSKCWKDLGVQDWLKKWNETTPTCDANVIYSRDDDNTTVNTENCCLPGEAWSTCFLRLEKAQTGYDCTKINPQICSWSPSQARQTGVDAAAVHYILRSIYTVNNFFVTYYNALQFAVANTDKIVQTMVNEIDRLKTQSVLEKILSILVAALAFLGAPSIGAAVVDVGKSVSAVVKTAAQGAFVSLQQTPGLVKSLWPTGTVESRLIQVASVQQELGRTNGALSQRMTNALGVVMTDTPSFLQFTSSGEWISPEQYSIPEQTDNLTTILQYYITSLVMAKNGWYGVMADANSLDRGYYPTLESVVTKNFRNGVECDPNTHICVTDKKKQMALYTIRSHGYMPPDRNTAWWWSPSTHRLFTLVKNDVTDQLNSQKIMEDVLGNNWATMEFLLDGSFNCTWQGRADNADNVDLWPNGQLDFSCASQLPMKRNCADKNCFPGSALKNGKDCPFQQMDQKQCNRQ